VTHLFRLMSRLRVWLRWACALLLIGWVGYSDNLRVIRHWVVEQGTRFVPEDETFPARDRYVKRQRERRAEFEELNRLARWCRDPKDTDVRAVFITDRGLFRMLAQRSGLSSGDDIRYVYYARPWRLRDWALEIDRVKRLLDSPGDGREIAGLAAELAGRGKPYGDAPAWYVVLAADTLTKPFTEGKEIESKSNDWGREYRVFALRPAAGATSRP
jgi:hypothetical protein